MSHEVVFSGGAARADAVTSAEMKEIERKADEAGISYYQMMENAGTGAAEYIAATYPVAGKAVLIFCGKGNNGGDGFVVARKLTEKGASVRLILVEGEPRTADAIRNRQICGTMAIPMVGLTDEKDGGLISGAENSLADAAEAAELIVDTVEAADLIVDAIYGTGFHGGLREPVREAVKRINRSRAAVIALDIPSGLNGDTGEADEDAVRADCTIAFHRLKPAHLNERCAIYCGQIACISIGIER